LLQAFVAEDAVTGREHQGWRGRDDGAAGSAVLGSVLACTVAPVAPRQFGPGFCRAFLLPMLPVCAVFTPSPSGRGALMSALTAHYAGMPSRENALNVVGRVALVGEGANVRAGRGWEAAGRSASGRRCSRAARDHHRHPSPI